MKSQHVVEGLRKESGEGQCSISLAVLSVMANLIARLPSSSGKSLTWYGQTRDTCLTNTDTSTVQGDITKDAVYMDAERRFAELETETNKLHSESKKYFDAINGQSA